jgi:hypothetical protein
MAPPPLEALGDRAKSAEEGPPINEYGQRVVSFVWREQVQRMTGITLEGSTGFRSLELIRDCIAELFASESVPATATVVSDPAILVEATSRNWSFRLEPKSGLARNELVARFRFPNEGARLRRVRSASIEPEMIWPGAEVYDHAAGGFIIVDKVAFGRSVQEGQLALAKHSLARAHELHCILQRPNDSNTTCWPSMTARCPAVRRNPTDR